MKLLTAIIKPFKMDDVRAALSDIGVQGITVHRGEGLRPSAWAHRTLSRVPSTWWTFCPRSKLEIAVGDAAGGRYHRCYRQGG